MHDRYAKYMLAGLLILRPQNEEKLCKDRRNILCLRAYVHMSYWLLFMKTDEHDTGEIKLISL